jgi:hypothetical protein
VSSQLCVKSLVVQKGNTLFNKKNRDISESLTCLGVFKIS